MDNRIKIVIAFIIGLILSGSIVYAVAVSSEDITYDNSKSHLKDANNNDVDNVKDAIDVLYNKVSSSANSGSMITDDFNVIVDVDLGNSLTLSSDLVDQNVIMYFLKIGDEIKDYSTSDTFTYSTTTNTLHSISIIAITSNSEIKSSRVLNYTSNSKARTEMVLNDFLSNTKDGVKVSYSTSYHTKPNAYGMFDGSTNTPYTNDCLGVLFGGNNTDSNYIKIEFPETVVFSSYNIIHGVTGRSGIGTISQTILYGSNDDINYEEIGRGVTQFSKNVNEDIQEYKYYKITIKSGSE